MARLFPINIPVPIVAGANVARVVGIDECRIREFGGSLRVLISGTFTVELLNLTTGALLGSLSWTSAGVQETALDAFVPDGEGLRVDVTSLGVGAVDAFLTIWAFTPRTDD